MKRASPGRRGVSLAAFGAAAAGLLYALWTAVIPSAQAGPAEDAAYRNCVEPVPSSPPPPAFVLSHAYPATKPTAPAAGYPWEAFDFKTQPSQYVKALLDYARADLEPVGWEASRVPTKWFHAPWMAYGPASGSGREYFHGMTRERPVHKSELIQGASDAITYADYAVGYYNDVGGYTFGQVFAADPAHPDIAKARFENGAMSIKLLFTSATAADVPSLASSLEWDCNVYDAGPRKRVPTKLRLLQVDVAVRDSRNDALTGWVFGTFAYNGAAAGTAVFDRLEPVGLMWGNDPTVLPNSGTLRETWANPTVGTYQHMGRAKRLNGPVDNPLSSCLSCHSTAQIPKPRDMVPPRSLTEQQALKWFDNVKAGDPFEAGGQSLDYSLQMGVAVLNARAWARANPTLGPSPAPALGPKSALPEARPEEEVIDQFTRDGDDGALTTPGPGGVPCPK